MYIIPAHILKLHLRAHVEPIKPTHAIFNWRWLTAVTKYVRLQLKSLVTDMQKYRFALTQDSVVPPQIE